MDRANQAILEQLETHQKDIKSLREEFISKLDKIEKLLLSKPVDAENATSMSEEQDTKPPSAVCPGSPNQPAISGQKPVTSAISLGPGTRDQKMIDASPSESFNTNSTESSSIDFLPSVAKQNAIHTEHNTAAQKLFRWPAIKALLQKCQRLHFTDSSENYVFNMELSKGPLHLYGRAQGPDPGNGSHLMGAASPGASSTSAPSEEASDASSPMSIPELLWGHGFHPYVGDSKSEYNAGGLNADNTLKLDAKTVTLLYTSYLSHIQILHPILDETVLLKNIESFKRRYGGFYDPGSSKAGFAVPTANANIDALRDAYGGFHKPLKRKHSDGQYWPDAGFAQTALSPKPMLERSPTTAIVLLVMALGKICECRDALPAPVTGQPKDASYHTRRSYSPAGFPTDSPPSFPVRHSPSSSSYSTAHSPVGLARQNHLSPRSSEAGSALHRRNLDVIPGLAYYAQATDILGNMTGSHDITYVQCCILAGLYAGQLANAVESLVWIQSAARGCCILARE